VICVLDGATFEPTPPPQQRRVAPHHGQSQCFFCDSFPSTSRQCICFFFTKLLSLHFLMNKMQPNECLYESFTGSVSGRSCPRIEMYHRLYPPSPPVLTLYCVWLLALYPFLFFGSREFLLSVIDIAVFFLFTDLVIIRSTFSIPARCPACFIVWVATLRILCLYGVPQSLSRHCRLLLYTSPSLFVRRSWCEDQLP